MEQFREALTGLMIVTVLGLGVIMAIAAAFMVAVGLGLTGAKLLEMWLVWLAS